MSTFILEYLSHRLKKNTIIPPDFDSSSVNIGLGSLLSRYHANQIPFQMWKEDNSNFTHHFKEIKNMPIGHLVLMKEQLLILGHTLFYGNI